MTMRSREFLGVKLVPMGSRPRKAVKVYVGELTYALLSNGAVAIASRDVFGERFDRWTYLRASVAGALAEIGAITADHAASFIKSENENLARKMARQAVDDLGYPLEALGLKLTRAQQRAIAKLTK